MSVNFEIKNIDCEMYDTTRALFLKAPAIS